jgi:endonuclease/exonuclease/phosphatase family metal-dependent hydrolase
MNPKPTSANPGSAVPLGVPATRRRFLVRIGAAAAAGVAGVTRLDRLAAIGAASGLPWLGGCAGDPTDEPRDLVVLSYNVHHCEGDDGRIDLPRVAAVIRESGADLVSLQEVDVGTARSGGVDQAHQLAELAGYPHVAFAEAMPLQGGSFGQAVLSRFPLEDRVTHPLPAIGGAEPRVALIVQLRVPEIANTVRFVATHLDHLDDATNRSLQIKALAAALVQLGDSAVIVAGDLNCEFEANEMAPLAAAFLCVSRSAGPTWPSHAPNRTLDHVLIRRTDPFHLRSSQTLPFPAPSDHLPLRAILTPA